MGEVLAYFLTWSGYGTWLHGDPRGSVDDKHSTRETPRLAPDPEREDRENFAMSGAPHLLSPEARAIVEATIRRHCEIRNWQVRAVNPRSTHVHVVVSCGPGVSPETAMEQFKAWCTRKLREAGLAEAGQKVLTEHGSTRWIDTETSLAKAVFYVQSCQ